MHYLRLSFVSFSSSTRQVAAHCVAIWLSERCHWWNECEDIIKLWNFIFLWDFFYHAGMLGKAWWECHGAIKRKVLSSVRWPLWAFMVAVRRVKYGRCAHECKLSVKMFTRTCEALDKRDSTPSRIPYFPFIASHRDEMKAFLFTSSPMALWFIRFPSRTQHGYKNQSFST